mmetsp:Transcript_102425/g.142661  ORF Transcript_102425/g.142661 Transcript_102425/m.142661 type:complete len:215 (+) Transcript_102425:360-1004(+)
MENLRDGSVCPFALVCSRVTSCWLALRRRSCRSGCSTRPAWDGTSLLASWRHQPSSRRAGARACRLAPNVRLRLRRCSSSTSCRCPQRTGDARGCKSHHRGGRRGGRRRCLLPQLLRHLRRLRLELRSRCAGWCSTSPSCPETSRCASWPCRRGSRTAGWRGRGRARPSTSSSRSPGRASRPCHTRHRPTAGDGPRSPFPAWCSTSASSPGTKP